jgi:hypothetical protein
MGRLIAVIVVVVALVAVIGGVGYWYVKKHQRISLAAVKSKVASSENADGVICVEKAAHGRRWHCAGTVNTSGKSTPTCFNVVVDWHGSTTIRALKPNQCKDDGALQPVLSG